MMKGILKEKAVRNVQKLSILYCDMGTKSQEVSIYTCVPEYICVHKVCACVYMCIRQRKIQAPTFINTYCFFPLTVNSFFSYMIGKFMRS